MIGIYGLKLNKERHPVLIKERAVECDIEVVTEPRKVKELFENLFDVSNLAEENLYLIALVGKCKVLGVCVVSNGSNKCALCDSSAIFTRALLLGATGIIVVHNHVSGNVAPSKEDYECLNKLNKAANIMDIVLHDFVILGNDYYSAYESGDLDNN